MANFVKEKYNSMPEQVEENKKNIEILESYIKEVYKSSVDLGDTSVTVAIADTNANADTIDGWLISQDGYLYKITSGDGTNLLIEYYTRLRGDDGADDIDDSSTSLTTLWSSQKTSNEILGLIDDNSTLNNKTWSSDKISQVVSYITDKGIFASSTPPSLYDGNLYYPESDLLNPSPSNSPKYNDLIIYIDGDGKTKYLYQITGVSGDYTKYYVTQIAEFGGGTQQYLHNVILRMANNGNSYHGRISLQIINDDASPFTYASLWNYLNDNGFTTSNKLYSACGGSQVDVSGNPQHAWVYGIMARGTQELRVWAYYTSGYYDYYYDYDITGVNMYIADENPIAL